MFIEAQRKPLRQRGRGSLEVPPRSDIAPDAHVSVSEWGNIMLSGLRQAVRITAWNSGG